MARERNEVILSIRVESIYLSAESFGRDEVDLTPEVIEKVIQRVEALELGGLDALLDVMIQDAIEEEDE